MRIFKDGESTLFVPSDAMRAIHECARDSRSRREALETAAKLMNRKLFVNEIYRFLRAHPEDAWLRDWVFVGEVAPDRVKVASAVEMQRAKAAWGYPEILKRVDVDKNMYACWYKMLPTANRIGWLRWLYGDDAPEGWAVVGGPLARLHKESTIKGCCKASGVFQGSVTSWKSDRALRVVLSKAIEAAGKAGRKSPSEEEKLKSLGTIRETAIRRYAQAATLPARLKRANVVTIYYKFLKSVGGNSSVVRKAADQIEELTENEGLALLSSMRPVDRRLLEVMRYLDGERRTATGRYFTGEICEGFFVPSAKMLAFREAARDSAAESKAHLLRQLPCANLWFLDCAIPKRWGSRRADRNLATVARQQVAESKEAGKVTDCLVLKGSQIRYGQNKPVRVIGIVRAVLAAVIEAGGSITRERLTAVLPGEANALRVHLTSARDAIREAVGRDGKYDPIPNTERGKGFAAWEIDADLKARIEDR